MATVVLQVAGAAIGGAIGGPVGAAIGRAVGAAAGYAIDQQLFSKDQVIKGGRLENTRYLSSTEGTPVPKVYGRVRIGGQLVWATRFEERSRENKRGGKGGPSVTSVEYKYFANFAVGLCEGKINHFGRIWADGKEIDQSKFTIRKYGGGEKQLPDPLIEALQGVDKTPAFNGTAYVVFEDFPLDEYGNRIPQISFEIVRSIAEVDKQIKAVTLIPGATEFGYSPAHLITGKKGHSVSENRHVLVAGSDWDASLDELQDLCPALESVALVVSWFGTDLRAGDCKIEPRCVHRDTNRPAWSVNGLTRQTANLVSEIDGDPVYGGTPSDKSVLDAIADLKDRGLKVVFYPFVMMDVSPGNVLPDPYGGSSQAAFPWRGRITCHPAPGQPGSVDQSSLARTQINNLVGVASLNDFSSDATGTSYNGPVETSFRRMILHYAYLCEAAGGVDRFLIGSEMPGLTRVRDEADNFPFVDALVDLAEDVRQILGDATKISYAADWSEYFGYHPPGQQGDAHFNLDPLWASPNIDAVAIDNYMPIADWHENGDPGNPEVKSRHDLEYLKQNLANGEGKDWYYAGDAARREGQRLPITDGSGEPWIWGYKALADWWLNPHHNRVDGQRQPNPTAWIPGSKPVWFTEIGCPAIDRGANQPNLFIDSKSSESAFPWFSKTGRDDLMQLRYLQACLEFWGQPDATANPLSPTNGSAMLSSENIFVWAWDARPYPAFPLFGDVWKDWQNWHRGHWINGRIGSCPVDDLILQIFEDHGLDPPIVRVDGHLEGYVISGELNPRNALEPLLGTFKLTVTEQSGKVRILGKNYGDEVELDPMDVVQENEAPGVVLSSESEALLARQLQLSHGEIESNFDSTTTTSRRSETASQRQITMELPAVISRGRALALADARLRDQWSARNSVRLALSQKHLALESSDTFVLGDATYQIEALSIGLSRDAQARGISRFDEAGIWLPPSGNTAALIDAGGQPFAVMLNLPLGQDAMDPAPRVYCAALRNPWNKPIAVYVSPGETEFKHVVTITQPALIGELVTPLANGPSGRWDYLNSIRIRMLDDRGNFQSAGNEYIYAGANALAVETSKDSWEIIQYQSAELVSQNEWRLKNLLRGQLGTEVSDNMTASEGALVLILDDAIQPVELPNPQIGTPLNWRVGPVDQDYGSSDYVGVQFVCSHISKRPMRPCHLRSRQDANAIHLDWKRRSRVNSDSWQFPETPMDFAQEQYRVAIFDIFKSLKREATVSAPTFTYGNTERALDLGTIETPFEVVVSQVDETGRNGPGAALTITP